MWIYVIRLLALTTYSSILALVKQFVYFFLLCFFEVKDLDRNINWTITIFNMALMIATFRVLICQCAPFQATWNGEVPSNRINKFAFTTTVRI